MSQDLGYVLYSALGSFYIPVIILVMVYWRIYIVTKNHSRQRLRETRRTDQTLCQLAAATRENAIQQQQSNGTGNGHAVASSNKVSDDATEKELIVSDECFACVGRVL